jgi:hypothetical protein
VKSLADRRISAHSHDSLWGLWFWLSKRWWDTWGILRVIWTPDVDYGAHSSTLLLCWYPVEWHPHTLLSSVARYSSFVSRLIFCRLLGCHFVLQKGLKPRNFHSFMALPVFRRVTADKLDEICKQTVFACWWQKIASGLQVQSWHDFMWCCLTSLREVYRCAACSVNLFRVQGWRESKIRTVFLPYVLVKVQVCPRIGHEDPKGA